MVVTVASIILFLLSIPVLNASSISLVVICFYSIFAFTMLMFISISNIIGYIYNKLEFLFLSLGLTVIQFFSAIYVWDIGGQVILGALFILTLVGYIFQNKKNN